ncbi:MAG: TetR/AcrR family transcriptional regulator [Ardenticatenaceae bacterium]|nr:TetR/AcrR family transcriptional regulator [Ardenticatenaceae bacterium]
MSFTKSFEHKQKLLDAALAEFNAYGYEQASINRILDAAGMSKGQFYYHFKNKEALYFALIEMSIQQKLAYFQNLNLLDGAPTDIFSLFKMQIRYGLIFAREYPAVHDLSQSFLRERGNPIYEKVMTRYDFKDNEVIGQLIEGAYVRGEFREDLPLPFIKQMIGYLFNQAADFANLENMAEMESNLNYLIDFMRSGLARNSG